MKLKKPCLFIALCAFLPLNVSSEPTQKELASAILLSANYLVRQVLPNGQMVYRQHRRDEPYKQYRYNLLRHAGVIYSLGQYHREYQNKQTAAAIIQTSSWLENCCYKELEGWDAAAAIWSMPDITGNHKKPIQAKLGASGLGLVAFSELYKLQPEKILLKKLRRLGRFIVYMQKTNGAFFSKYIPSKMGRDDSWTSLYYPGEAALGLIRLAQIDNNPLWLESAINALSYLAESRKNSSQVPADHWALIATAELFNYYDESQSPHSENIKPLSSQQSSLLRVHALQIVNSILNEQVIAQQVELMGSFGADGRTTPTATRLEGLLAARPIIKTSYPDMIPRLDKVLRDGIQFLLDAQIKVAPYDGGIPRSVLARAKRSDELRIDYVQHALSAWLEYRKLKLRNLKSRKLN